MQDQESEDNKLNTAARSAPDPTVSDAQRWSQCLVQISERRDKVLFAQFFNHFGPRLKGYVMRLGMTSALAEEVTQEAMLAVWRKAHLFNPAKASASTWLYTLTRNLCIDRMRRERAVEVEWQDDDADPDPRDRGEHAVIEQRMQAAIAKLPDTQAQVLFLSYYEGKSHSEIAEQLGIPLGSVKSRLRLAFGKLKQQWGEEL